MSLGRKCLYLSIFSMFTSNACRPFFDKVTLSFPNVTQPLVISAPGATTQPYIKSVTVNGVPLAQPVITHEDIAHGGEIVFEMADTPQEWASATLVSASLSGVRAKPERARKVWDSIDEWAQVDAGSRGASEDEDAQREEARHDEL